MKKSVHLLYIIGCLYGMSAYGQIKACPFFYACQTGEFSENDASDSEDRWQDTVTREQMLVEINHSLQYMRYLFPQFSNNYPFCAYRWRKIIDCFWEIVDDWSGWLSCYQRRNYLSFQDVSDLHEVVTDCMYSVSGNDPDLFCDAPIQCQRIYEALAQIHYTMQCSMIESAPFAFAYIVDQFKIVRDALEMLSA